MRNIISIFGSAVLSVSQAGGFPNWDHSDSIECDGNYVESVRVESGERQNTFIRLLDSDGDRIHPVMVFSGSVVELCEHAVFLLIDNNVQYETGPSFLMSNVGDILVRFDFGEIRTVGVSDDRKLFWIQSSIVRSGEPATRLRIFDYTGDPVRDLERDEAGKVRIKYDNEQYEIDTLAPDWPG